MHTGTIAENYVLPFEKLTKKLREHTSSASLREAAAKIFYKGGGENSSTYQGHVKKVQKMNRAKPESAKFIAASQKSARFNTETRRLAYKDLYKFVAEVVSTNWSNGEPMSRDMLNERIVQHFSAKERRSSKLYQTHLSGNAFWRRRSAMISAPRSRRG